MLIEFKKNDLASYAWMISYLIDSELMIDIECEFTEGELLKTYKIERESLKDFKNGLKSSYNIHKFENTRKECKKQQKKNEINIIEKQLEDNINNILFNEFDDNNSTEFDENKSNDYDKSFSHSDENVFFISGDFNPSNFYDEQD